MTGARIAVRAERNDAKPGGMDAEEIYDLGVGL